MGRSPHVVSKEKDRCRVEWAVPAPPKHILRRHTPRSWITPQIGDGVVNQKPLLWIRAGEQPFEPNSVTNLQRHSSRGRSCFHRNRSTRGTDTLSQVPR